MVSAVLWTFPTAIPQVVEEMDETLVHRTGHLSSTKTSPKQTSVPVVAGTGTVDTGATAGVDAFSTGGGAAGGFVSFPIALSMVSTAPFVSCSWGVWSLPVALVGLQVPWDWD